MTCGRQAPMLRPAGVTKTCFGYIIHASDPGTGRAIVPAWKARSTALSAASGDRPPVRSRWAISSAGSTDRAARGS
jgi:hypothetical protein